MRPAGENPHGRARRQPERRGGRRGDGVRDQVELAVAEPRQGGKVVRLMKRILLLIPAIALSGCMSVPAAPAAPYHAVGTEPFWILLIDGHDITFVQPDAQPIRQPTPKVIVGFAG